MNTFLEKILLTAVLVVGVYAVITTFEKRKVEALYNAELEKGITIINDSIDALNLQIKDLTKKHQTKTSNTQKTSAAINDKLQEDENIINNSDPSDDELNAFIAKHENAR